MFFGKSWDEWISQYALSHQHPINRFCHTIGIPLIALSIPIFVISIFVSDLWKIPIVLFIVGWIFQFAGHAVEGKPPEFLKIGVFYLSDLDGGLQRSKGVGNTFSIQNKNPLIKSDCFKPIDCIYDAWQCR
jgi:uncharacterized membrane protein YGL010W